MELVKGGVRVTKSYKVGFEVLQSTDINWNITTSLLIGNKINNLPDNGGGSAPTYNTLNIKLHHS